MNIYTQATAKRVDYQLGLPNAAFIVSLGNQYAPFKEDGCVIVCSSGTSKRSAQ